MVIGKALQVTGTLLKSTLFTSLSVPQQYLPSFLLQERHPTSSNLHHTLTVQQLPIGFRLLLCCPPTSLLSIHTCIYTTFLSSSLGGNNSSTCVYVSMHVVRIPYMLVSVAAAPVRGGGGGGGGGGRGRRRRRKETSRTEVPDTKVVIIGCRNDKSFFNHHHCLHPGTVSM